MLVAFAVHPLHGLQSTIAVPHFGDLADQHFDGARFAQLLQPGQLRRLGIEAVTAMHENGSGRA